MTAPQKSDYKRKTIIPVQYPQTDTLQFVVVRRAVMRRGVALHDVTWCDVTWCGGTLIRPGELFSGLGFGT